MTAKPDKPHHHGDLRNALIQSGMALLAEGGSSALTLRKAAAHAGVSHAAPTHHFGNLAGLLTAIGTEGFVVFRETMLRVMAEADPSPRAQLQAACRGYVKFAQDHPALLDLMFRSENLRPSDSDYKRAANRSYDVLRQIAAPFVSDATQARAVEIQIWSLVHGYAVLHTAGQFENREMPPAPMGDEILSLLDALPLASSSHSAACPLEDGQKNGDPDADSKPHA